jgi:Na+-transporting NADH:ubiquinone oxidoreductase subunit A
MIKYINKSKYLLLFILLTQSNLAFSQGDGVSGANFFTYGLIAIGLVLLLFAVTTIADNLLQLEAKKVGLDTANNNYGLFPKLASSLKPNLKYQEGTPSVKLSKGYDLKVSGTAEKQLEQNKAKRYAIMPAEFIGMSPIPKVVVAEGDEVKAGDILFFDKKRPDIKYASPVSGEVVEIRRGAKRAISHIIILADTNIQYRKTDAPDLNSATREQLVDFLLETGGWPMINQRPFDVIPEPDVIPKNIFISTFKTGPNNADQAFVVKGKEAEFQKGLDVLVKLTNGKVFLGLDGNGKSKPASVFSDAEGVGKVYFSGKHPSGNVGVQIHHIAPIKNGDNVWTLGVAEVATIGKLFLSGVYDVSRVVALTGGEVKSPCYINTFQGASVEELISGKLKSDHVRKINGDVLSGRAIGEDDFLNFREDQITVIKEGDNYELFGWLLPIKPRPSVSGTFPNFLFKKHKFDVDTNTHGEKRAFVVTGQYEDVLPMDIYPQHLMKAIMANDFEKMEGLGINELSEEDVALCEFVCTSKIPVQQILREGLESMREQL